VHFTANPERNRKMFSGSRSGNAKGAAPVRDWAPSYKDLS
jgi:hypothetical protein